MDGIPFTRTKVNTKHRVSDEIKDFTYFFENAVYVFRVQGMETPSWDIFVRVSLRYNLRYYFFHAFASGPKEHFNKFFLHMIILFAEHLYSTLKPSLNRVLSVIVQRRHICKK
jgi:hypothetical protein